MTEPSLKRLLALNKSTQPFHDDLHVAADIVKLPKDWSWRGVQIPRDFGHVQVSDERAEWLLKWLLDKLNSKQRPAVHPRSESLSWTLLARLLPLITVRTTAKLLREVSFLGILESLLVDATDLPVTPPNINGSGSANSPSRKRKRGHDATTTVSDHQTANLTDLFRSIEDVLTVLLSWSDQSGADSATMIDAEHLRAALRSDIEQTGRVLRLWLLQTLRICQAERPLLVNLSPVIRLWSLCVSRTASSSQEIASSFSEHCLVPCIHLLGVRGSGEPEAEARETVRMIHEMLVEYVIIPIRSTAMVAASSRKQKDDADFKQAFADGTLEPLHQEVAKLGSEHGRYSTAVKVFLRTISVLLDLALRISPRGNPKQKMAEEHWLRILLVALATSAGNSITGDWTIAIHPFPEVALGELLDVCAQRDFSPGPEILASTIRRYSGMCLPEEEGISWSLVSKTMRLDSSIFLPGSTDAAEADIFANAGPLHELIIRHLSVMPWKAEYDPHTTDAKVAVRDGLGVAASVVAFMDQNHLTPTEFVSSIPVALLKAYARSRNLVVLLSIWRTELVKATRHIVIGTGNCSIWEDQSLTLALRSVLQASLTDRQVVDTISTFSTPFDDVEEAQNIMYIFTELRQNAQGTGAAANLVLLDAVVGAISSDATIEASRGALLTLQRNLVEMGSKQAINKLPIMNRIWRLLAGISRLLLPSSAESQRKSMAANIIASACYSTALESVCDASECDTRPAAFERGMQALAFILAINALDRSTPANEEGLEACIDCAKVIDRMPRHDLAGEMLRFPESFDSISAPHRRALFGHLFARAAGETFQGENKLRTRPVNPDFERVLDALIDLAKSNFSLDAKKDLLCAISFDIQHLSPNVDAFDRANFAQKKMAMFASNSIPRELREKCLDSLYKFLCAARLTNQGRSTDTPDRALESHLAFLVKLMEIPNATAVLSNESSALLELCDNITLLDDASCNGLYEELVRRALHHSSSQETFSESLAKNVLRRLKGEKKTASPDYSSWIAMRQLILQASPATAQTLLMLELQAFSKVNRQILAEDGDASKLERQDKEFLLLLDSLRLHASLIEASEQAQTELRQWDILQAIDWHARRRPSSVLAVDRYKLATVFGSAFDECLATQNALHDCRSVQAQRQLLNDLERALMKRPVEQRLAVIPEIDDLTLDGKLLYPYLLVLKILVTTLPRSLKGQDEFELRIDLLARLSNAVAASHDGRMAGATFECIKAMLAERSWLVSQHGIDALITNLTILTASAFSALDNDQFGGLYLQTCAIGSTVVSLHRVKLQGRFHLLLPLLINLLDLLFIPYSRTDRISDRPHRADNDIQPLAARHATGLARFLSALSSPTMSSVTTFKRKRAEAGAAVPLKDETKTARAYVGVYIPGLLAAYCTAQLKGRLAPEVKDALMPGLWAAMGTVEMNAWKAMSERLTDQERAIWQSVWTEWSRNGGTSRRNVDHL